MLVTADNDLLVSATDLDDIERRSRGHPEPLALTNGKVVDAAVLANNLSAGCNQFPGGVRQRLALLGEVSVNEPLVVSAGHKADLLGVRLLRDSQPMPMRQLADLRLGHVAER